MSNTAKLIAESPMRTHLPEDIPSALNLLSIHEEMLLAEMTDLAKKTFVEPTEDIAALDAMWKRFDVDYMECFGCSAATVLKCFAMDVRTSLKLETTNVRDLWLAYLTATKQI